MKKIFRNIRLSVTAWFKQLEKIAEEQQKSNYYKNLVSQSRKKFTLEVNEDNNIWICFDGEYVENLTSLTTKQICEKISLYRRNWIESKFRTNENM